MPYTVNQLGYNDINYKFFNHVNWKGMCDDQNFASIDQETFSDCDNMYVDAEAVLRSRPSIKPDNEIFSKPTTTALSIKDIRTFGNYQVVVWIGSVNNYVAFYKDKVYKAHSNITQSKYTIVQADNKIFVLQAPLSTGVTNNCMYDQTDDILSTDQALIKSYFYKPITKVYINGNAGTDVESPNELTTGYREEFLWKDDKQGTFTLNQFVAHYLQNNNYTGNSKVEIGNEAYDVHITEGIDNIFVKQADITTQLPIDTFQANALAKVKIVVKNNVVVLGYPRTDAGTSIVVSVDYGKTFTSLPFLPEIIRNSIQISEDLTIVTVKSKGPDVATNYGIYAYSIAPDESGEKRFTVWTDLLAYNNVTDTGTIETSGYYVKSHNKFMWARISVNSEDATPIAILSNLFDETLKKYKLLFASVTHASMPSGMEVRTEYVPVVVFGQKAIAVAAVSYTVNNKFYTILARHSLQGSTPDTDGYIIPTDARIAYLQVTESSTITSQEMLYKGIILYSDGVNIYTISPNTVGEVHNLISVANAGTGTDAVKVIFTNLTAAEVAIVGTNNKILTKSKLYENKTHSLLHANVVPVSTEPLVYAINETDESTSMTTGKIYSSALVDQVSIINTYDGDLQNYDYDYEAELSDYYFAKGKALFISAAGAKQDEDKDFMWYMPKINTQYFDYDITGLHPISTTEMAVFLKDSIYYCTYDSDVKAYRYYKSRVPLGKEAGSDVITTYDNKYTVFCTNRGLVAMAYQDFINSTEQALTFLSDTIFDKFSDWNKGAIKLYLYKFWLIVYRLDDNTAFVFDMRNNSWWPVSYKYDLLKTIVTIDDTPVLLLNGKTYLFNKSSEEYYDDSDGTKQIVWYFQSQKLHFNAINYYKHIVNMTVSSISDNKFTTKFVLKTTNYRKLPQIGKNTDQANRDDTTVSVQVEIIRVFSKRLNYYKVNEYQYKISSIADGDDEKKITTYKPLCITSIAIKYLITGQVR